MKKKILNSKLGVVIFVLLSSLMLITGIATAEWALTNVLNSWDTGQARWENGNINMYLDGNPQPFYHTIVAPNNNEFNSTPVVDACGASTSTTFAGSANIGLYHTDTDADLNAPGFQSTSSYQLVSCDLDQSGGANDSQTPNTVLDTCTTDNSDGDIDRCEISNQDTVTLCSTGNCKDEIITTVSINLDTNCDGQIDDGYDQDVCLYWTAEKPPFTAPFWQGNYQGRIFDAGGDKTINFNILGPTAVTLQQITSNVDMSWVVTAMSIVLLLGILTFIAVRKSRQSQ